MQGICTILGRGHVPGLKAKTPGWLLALLQPLSGPFLTFSCMWAVMPVLMPGLWRSLLYWQRFVPIMSSYMVTNMRYVWVAGAFKGTSSMRCSAHMMQFQHRPHRTHSTRETNH